MERREEARSELAVYLASAVLMIGLTLLEKCVKANQGLVFTPATSQMKCIYENGNCH